VASASETYAKNLSASGTRFAERIVRRDKPAWRKE